MFIDSSNIIGGLTEAIIGGLFGVLLTYLAVRLQEKRKIVEYEIFSMPLLRFTPAPERPIVVSVDKSLLNTDGLGKGELIQVDSAYGFEIEIQNSGNHPIDKCAIEVTLDENAKIIEYDSQPTSKPGRVINIQKDVKMLNVLRIFPEFLNKKERLQIRVTSTGNTSQKCEVGVLGLGLQVKERSYSKFFTMYMAVALVGLLIFSFLMSSISPTNPIGKKIIDTWGLQMRQVSQVDWSFWVFLFLLLVFLPLYYLMYREIFKKRRRSRKNWGLGFNQEKATVKEIFKRHLH